MAELSGPFCCEDPIPGWCNYDYVATMDSSLVKIDVGLCSWREIALTIVRIRQGTWTNWTGIGLLQTITGTLKNGIQ